MITTALPDASVPLTIRLGTAKYRAARRTSPWRSAAAQSLITATATALGWIPVGPGVGTVASPDPSCGSAGNAGADRAGARRAWRTVVLELECVPLDPHPTTAPVAITAINDARWTRAITSQS